MDSFFSRAKRNERVTRKELLTAIEMFLMNIIQIKKEYNLIIAHEKRLDGIENRIRVLENVIEREFLK